MIDKGQMLSRHDFSKVNWGILAAAALLFSAGAALLVAGALVVNTPARRLAQKTAMR